MKKFMDDDFLLQTETAKDSITSTHLRCQSSTTTVTSFLRW